MLLSDMFPHCRGFASGSAQAARRESLKSDRLLLPFLSSMPMSTVLAPKPHQSSASKGYGRAFLPRAVMEELPMRAVNRKNCIHTQQTLFRAQECAAFLL